MRNWLIGLAFMPGFALAESGADTGDTAWILTATALVLFMTLPGLSFFLRRPGAQQKRTFGINAMFCNCLWRVFDLVDSRLQSGIWRR